MSTTTTKLPYREAMAIAGDLLVRLETACERILIAGSLRRMKPEIGDIEIVAIPKIEDVMADMFGQHIEGSGRNLLNERLVELGVTITKGVKDDAKFRQFTWRDVPVDLFVTTPECWGVIATIRTGSAEFSHWLMTERRKNGGCPSHLKVKEGRIWFASEPLSTPNEIDVFRTLEVPWIDPPERTTEYAQSLWRRR